MRSKKCKCCGKEIVNKEYDYCPWCGGDWKGGIVRDKTMHDRDLLMPLLEEARNEAYKKKVLSWEDAEKYYWYIDGWIEGDIDVDNKNNGYKVKKK